jgi:hypothetical protein
VLKLYFLIPFLPDATTSMQNFWSFEEKSRICAPLKADKFSFNLVVNDRFDVGFETKH